MAWKIRDLAHATEDELLRYSTNEKGTLRRLHAIDELARRAEHDTGLTPKIAIIIAAACRFSELAFGVPAGYMGASRAYKAHESLWKAVLFHLAALSQHERDGLLDWLDPSNKRLSQPAATPIPISANTMYELIVQGLHSDTDMAPLHEIIHSEDREYRQDTTPLELFPHDASELTTVFLPIRSDTWTAINHRRAEISKALQVTTIWPAPTEFDILGPKLHLSVSADGTRELVQLEPEHDGYRIVALECPCQ